jgi:replicative DNA helicase
MLTEERPSSRDFEVYFVLSAIHDSRFREYVAEYYAVEMITEFDCQYIYGTVLKFRKKKKPITFFGVFETIRRDTVLSEKKADQICSLLKPYILVGADLSSIESMLDGILPIVEEVVKKRIVEMASVKTMNFHEEGKIDEAIELWGKVIRQSIYQKPNSVSAWNEIHNAKGDMSKALDYKPGIPTGIHGLDESHHVEYLDQKLFFKGCARGHLGIVLADSNVGKSTFVLNIGLYQSLREFSVRIYSLEMDATYFVARAVSILTGIPTDDIIIQSNNKRIQKKIAQIEEKYPKRGRLDISHYTRDTLNLSMIAHDLTMDIKEGDPTDVVIVDYLDLMKADRQFKEVRHEIGHNAVALRALGDEFGCAVFTPSQMNRGTFKDKKRTKDRSNISEDYSKVFTCDYLWVLTEFLEDVKEIGKPQAQRELVKFYCDKNRFGRNNFSFVLAPDKNTGRFFDVFPQLP